MEFAVGAWSFPEIQPLTDAEFSRFQSLIQQEAGIFLSDAKRALLVGRLARRLRQLGLTSFRKYYEFVSSEGENELRTLLNCVSTNETHFFREPMQFEYLRSVLIPSWLRASAQGSRHLRIWSAACSTGEEPYSIAMTALDALADFPEYSFEVFASDISTRVLEKAASGVYPISKAEEIPIEYRKAFMLKGRGESVSLMRVRDEVARKVRFERVNLVGEVHDVPGEFDIIFCRNVLIYFQQHTKAAVLSNLMSKLRPGGHLFLGHAETMHAVPLRTTSPMPNVYVCADAGRQQVS